LSITCTYVAGTQSNCLLQPLAPGLWNLTASITDEAGNASASSGSLALDVVDEVSAGEGEGIGADAGAGGAQLPSTGSSSLALMLWALTFLALGAVLWQMSTRRKLG
jgi:LPXTG-motif cell wall-anchored protein